MSVAELAERIGLHQNTVRAHLDLLVRSGLVTRRTEQRATPGRPREVFEATGAPEGDRNYQLLAQVLAGRLTDLTQDAATEAAAAGRRWVESAPPGATSPGGTTAPGGATVPPARTAPDAPPGTSLPLSPTDPDVAPVLRMLRTSGFAPELSPDGSAILLHHCPFLEVAREHPDVVCGVHLGLIQGELARTGGRLAATRILPFVHPTTCAAPLTPT